MLGQVKIQAKPGVVNIFEYRIYPGQQNFGDITSL